MVGVIVEVMTGLSSRSVRLQADGGELGGSQTPAVAVGAGAEANVGRAGGQVAGPDGLPGEVVVDVEHLVAGQIAPQLGPVDQLQPALVRVRPAEAGAE